MKPSVDNDNHIGRIGFKIFVKLGHDTACKFIKTDTVDAQVNIRLTDFEVTEKRRLKRGVFFCSCINQTVVDFAAFFLGLDNGSHKRSHFDKVWPCAGNYTNIQHNK